MARTQITPVTITQDAGVAEGAGTSITAALATVGVYVAPPAVTVTAGTGSFGPGWTTGSLVLLVTNVATAVMNVIIRGTGSGVVVAGTAQTSPYPSNAVFTQGSQGDLTYVVPLSSSAVIWPYTSDRFTQPDGNIYIDFSGVALAGTLFAFALSSPRLGGIVGA